MLKNKSLLIAAYALLIVIGGVIGFVVSKSTASLISSSVFALLLFSCSAYMNKGYAKAYDCAMILIGFLFVFFGYRFFLTYKVFPGAVMSLISGFLLIYLLQQRKQWFSTLTR